VHPELRLWHSSLSIDTAETHAVKRELVLELYGVRVIIAAPPELLPEISRRLNFQPARSRQVPRELERDEESARLDMEIAPLGDGWFLVSRDGEELIKMIGEAAIDHLETQVRQQVSMRSPEKVFMHAGVVGFEDRAIVVPGLSHSGKTTLVAALLRAGASYLSDEYAVLDARGRVHPFTKPLSIRGDKGEPQNYSAESIGASTSESALPVGLVVLSTYRGGAEWRPTPLSGGDAVLRLLRHTAQTRERPAASLKALRNMVEGAVVLSGERGEASELAPLLLGALAAAV
jgi:hypothetical protein